MNAMTKLSHYSLAAAALAAGLAFAGCHSNTTPAPITSGDPSNMTANGAQDPAEANLAGDGSTQVLGQSASYAPQQQAEQYAPQQQGQAPAATTDQNYDYQNPPSDDTEQPVYADQAPPPLPEYDQPPAPDPNYLWTPGYWAYGPGGYYWVPGAWAAAPYVGALWTPPYWGYYGGRYRYYHGYWGPHIGFYGGVDYGFGYIGVGFFGGYWNGPHFYYNSAVTRLRPGWGYGYNRPVVYGGRTYGFQPSVRISFNGGRGGLDVRPRPFEVAAMRERHEGPTTFQRENHEAALRNPGNSFNANHGRPAMAVAARPLGNVGAIRPTPAGVQPGRPGFNGRPAEGARPGQPSMTPGARPGEINRPGVQPGRPGEVARPGQPGTPGARPGEVNRPGVQPGRPGQPGVTPGARPGEVNRPGVQPGNGRPAEVTRPTPQPGARPAEGVRPGMNPGQPQGRPAPVTRPTPQPQQSRPQPTMQRPAPEARPTPQPQQARPQPMARPAPEARPAPAARPARAAAPARPAHAARPAPAAAPRTGRARRRRTRTPLNASQPKPGRPAQPSGPLAFPPC